MLSLAGGLNGGASELAETVAARQPYYSLRWKSEPASSSRQVVQPDPLSIELTPPHRPHLHPLHPPLNRHHHPPHRSFIIKPSAWISIICCLQFSSVYIFIPPASTKRRAPHAETPPQTDETRQPSTPLLLLGAVLHSLLHARLVRSAGNGLVRLQPVIEITGTRPDISPKALLITRRGVHSH